MLNTPEQLRAKAAWFRQFPNPKAQRAARLADLAATAAERCLQIYKPYLLAPPLANG